MTSVFVVSEKTVFFVHPTTRQVIFVISEKLISVRSDETRQVFSHFLNDIKFSLNRNPTPTSATHGTERTVYSLRVNGSRVNGSTVNASMRQCVHASMGQRSIFQDLEFNSIGQLLSPTREENNKMIVVRSISKLAVCRARCFMLPNSTSVSDAVLPRDHTIL